MSSLPLTIQTDRLLLRSFVRSDVEALAQYHLLPSMQRYTVLRTRNRDQVGDALEIMCGEVCLQRPGNTLTLAMIRKGDDQLLGHVSLHWSDSTASQGEVLFLINPAYAGLGFAAEALAALFDLAFGYFHLHRIMVRCDGRNHHSIKLMQQMGLRLEAHYREHALYQGEWDEELHFALLDREWQRSNTVRELPPRHRVA
ncbi:MAG: GNAT family N-acetyltransferase [Devosia sp.]